MNADNTKPLDYYLMPAIDITGTQVQLAEGNGLLFDAYRHETLDFLIGMARRVLLTEVA
jgi:hypothetical protein